MARPANEAAATRERKEGIGRRLKEVARRYAGGIKGFHAALLKAEVRRVPSRKELYRVFDGRLAATLELLEVASRLLSVNRKWLETGEGEQDVAPDPGWPSGAGQLRIGRFRQALATSLAPLYSPARAEGIAQNVADYIAGSVAWMDREPREDIVDHLTELCQVAPHLAAHTMGTSSYLAILAKTLLDLDDLHEEMFRQVSLRGRPDDQAQELSWNICWMSILDAAKRDALRKPIRRSKKSPPEKKKTASIQTGG